MAAVKPVGERLGRRDRADRTRARIVDAAYQLFLSQGFEATTMQEVAKAAGVAVQTVYLGFRTKSQLLAEVESIAVLGGEPSERWRDQPWAAELREERDPSRLLEIFVRVNADIIARLVAFVRAVGASALPNDAAAVDNRERGRDDFFGAVVDRLHALGALKPDLSVGRALDVVRVVVTVEGFVDLTTRRGWTQDEWCAWMTDLVKQQLLARSDARS